MPWKLRWEREDDEDKFMEAFKKFDSFDEMSPKDYPVFFIIRKII